MTCCSLIFERLEEKKCGPQQLHYSVILNFVIERKIKHLNQTSTGANTDRFSRLLRFNDLLTTALFVSHFPSPIHNLQTLANGR